MGDVIGDDVEADGVTRVEEHRLDEQRQVEEVIAVKAARADVNDL